LEKLKISPGNCPCLQKGGGGQRARGSLLDMYASTLYSMYSMR
jgi:hypothetical protein